MTIDVARSARDLERELRARGTAERAVSEKAYLKSELQHFGTTVWEIRRIVKELTSSHPDLTHDQLADLVGLLWSKPIHECRMSAVLLLELSPRLLGTDDLDLVESMIRGSTTWAYVDGLAANVAGALVRRFPEAANRLDSWSIDPVFWIRRSALLALIDSLKHGAPFARFGGYADAMLDEKEFFIRKAIGWVLRETSKTSPEEVFRWLLPRAPRASGVTLREAVKYLDETQREHVLTASGRRPGS